MSNEVPSWTIIAAALVAVTSILLSGLTSLLSTVIEQRRKSAATQIKAGRPTPPVSVGDVAGVEFVEQEISIDSTDNLLNRRLDEANGLLQQYQGQANLNGIANALLIFSQTVIGGILATSFIQETLAKQIVGVLGVFVLLATLLHQSYRPDIKARIAHAKARRLRWLIRKSENDKVRHGRDRYLDIIDKITYGLNKVDTEEEWEAKNASKDKEDDVSQARG